MKKSYLVVSALVLGLGLTACSKKEETVVVPAEQAAPAPAPEAAAPVEAPPADAAAPAEAAPADAPTPAEAPAAPAEEAK